MSSKIYKKDVFEMLSSLQNESIDLILTDPPYESLEKHRKVGTTTRLKNSKSSSNKWFKTIPNEKLGKLLSEFYRVLKNNRHLYIVCDNETMFKIVPIAEKLGFKFWKPIVWDKICIGMGYHYRCRYEFVLFFEKGKRKLNDLSVPDILTFKRIRNGYPTEKPVELMEVLINQSTIENEFVLDPFMGSASVGVAALLNRRGFIGSDISTDAFQISKDRLDSVKSCNFGIG